MSRISRKRHPLDWYFLGFFVINMPFIVYFIDFEQVAVPQTDSFEYPLFPPAWMIDIIHWYGRNFDPLLMARPVWWKVLIWMDVIFFGPFYAAAMYAFWKQKNWIRTPAIIWATALLINVCIIVSEEYFGTIPAPNPWGPVLAYGFWLLTPILMFVRIFSSKTLFEPHS